MPQQDSGRMRGFQLWINLPAAEKMKPAAYRDIQPEEIPLASLASGGTVKVIAGTLEAEGRRVAGPIQGLSTEPLYFDVHLPAGGRFAHALAAAHNAYVYPYEGQLRIGTGTNAHTLQSQEAGLFSTGGRVEVEATGQGVRFLLLAARPVREPVVQYGPFVMNTREEIEQAIRDYQGGRLT